MGREIVSLVANAILAALCAVAAFVVTSHGHF
jgi:hypothetical protein